MTGSLTTADTLLDLSRALNNLSTHYAITRDRTRSLKESCSQAHFTRGTDLLLSTQGLTTELVSLTRALATGPFAHVPGSRLLLADLTTQIGVSASASFLIAMATASDPLDGIGQPAAPELAAATAESLDEEAEEIDHVLQEAVDSLHLAAGTIARASRYVAESACAAGSTAPHHDAPDPSLGPDGLHEMATRINQFRSRLKALPNQPELPDDISITAHVDELTEITTAMAARIRACSSALASEISSQPTMAAITYSRTLAPLGEALKELGRMHAGIALYTHDLCARWDSDSSTLEGPRQQVDDLVAECCGAADGILEAAAKRLSFAGVTLARLASVRERPVGADLASPPPAPTAAATRAAKNR